MNNNSLSDMSAISDCRSVSSMQGIMKVRTLRESLCEQTKEQRDAARIRRSLRLLGLSRDHGVDLSTINSDDVLAVTFDTVKVREYPIILGDNPAVSDGPPLQIDWVYNDVDEFGLEEYETSRPTRRKRLQMGMPASYRIDFLKRTGFSTNDIFRQITEVNLVKRGRLETTTMLHRIDKDEKLERVKRTFTNIFSKRKKEERELMKSSMQSMNIQRMEANYQAQIEEETIATLICANRDAESVSLVDDEESK